MPTRAVVFPAIFLVVILAACKRPTTEAPRQPLATGGAQSFALLADGTRLLCPCAELLPIERRPAFPRIQGTARGPAPLQDECVYLAATSEASGERLALSVRRATGKLAFDEAQTLSDEVKILTRERRALGAQGAQLPFFMALITNRTGNERIALAHAADETLLIEVRESVPEDAPSLSAPPSYFDGLPERILALCR